MAAEVVSRGAVSALCEEPGSPEWAYGDTVRCTVVQRGLWSVVKEARVPKGTAGTGEMAGLYVLTCTAKKEKGDSGILTTVYEAGTGSGEVWTSATLPPDTWTVEPVELNPSVSTHPRYASLSAQQKEWAHKAAQMDDIKAATLALKNGVTGATIPPLLSELSGKIWKGRTNYYVSGVIYKWTSSSYWMPFLTKGGFIQSPQGPGFIYLPGDMQFLRQCDAVSVAGIVTVTRSWLGAPSGHWDPDLYSS